MRSFVLALLAVTGVGCGATASTVTAPHDETAAAPAPSNIPDEKPMVMAGVRCEKGECRCRELDTYGNPVDTDKETPVAAGQKRFELRFGRTTDEVKITIAGHGTFEHGASGEPSAACAYIDLPNGRHRVRYHVEALKAEQGISPLFMIKEWGQKAASWYDTLALRCGTQGPCTRSDVESWLKQLRTVERGIHDKCGSVRVQQASFAGEHAPDQSLRSLDVTFTLHVYDFDPTRPHGADCNRRSDKNAEPAE